MQKRKAIEPVQFAQTLRMRHTLYSHTNLYARVTQAILICQQEFCADHFAYD